MIQRLPVVSLLLALPILTGLGCVRQEGSVNGPQPAKSLDRLITVGQAPRMWEEEYREIRQAILSQPDLYVSLLNERFQHALATPTMARLVDSQVNAILHEITVASLIGPELGADPLRYLVELVRARRLWLLHVSRATDAAILTPIEHTEQSIQLDRIEAASIAVLSSMGDRSLIPYMSASMDDQNLAMRQFMKGYLEKSKKKR